MSGSTVEVAGVEISRPDKELFPGVTKLDLARYYERVAEVMLPHLRGRPVNMQRYPDGVDGPSFYEKKVPKHFPDWVRTAEVEGVDGPQRQVVVDDARTLVYLAQQACITPHTWLCREGTLDKPDQLIVDLDPSEGGTLRDVRRATRLVGELLDDLGLETFVKTTGSRGYHVLVPLQPRLSFDDVRGFARACAEVLVAREPDLVTLEHRKAKRGTRVYLDIGRNGYAQTAVPAYAVRPRPSASVSVPITWDELSRVRPDQHTVGSVPRRLGRTGDPWADVRSDPQSLGAARRKLARLA